MMRETKQVQLKNVEGKSLSVLFRICRENDADELISCIQEEYGDTYFKRDFYRKEYLAKKIREGSHTFLAAQLPTGEIIGMMLVRDFSPKESMCELASQIFRKKYRGYGMASPFVDYSMEIVCERDYSAVLSLPVLFHSVTQALVYKKGLRSTGFILNVFDMDKITHSYVRGKNAKHSQGIQILAMNKNRIDLLYIPIEHRKIVECVYENIGIRADICTDENAYLDSSRTTDSDSEMELYADDIQSSVEIRVMKIGAHFAAELDAVIRRYPLTGKWTCNIFLNCNDIHAVWAYRKLKKAGFFFCGIKPLCSRNEYMVLHHPGDIKICFEDYVISNDFERLLDYVKGCYAEQQKRGDAE